MRLLIDANIILDVLQKREGYWKDSSLVWKLCETEQAEGCVTALSLANLVYVMRKELNPGQVEDVMRRLALIFHLVDLTAGEIRQAAEAKWSDFEDALQSVAAGRIRADCIVTRNVRDFTDSRVPALTPLEYLDKM